MHSPHRYILRDRDMLELLILIMFHLYFRHRHSVIETLNESILHPQPERSRRRPQPRPVHIPRASHPSSIITSALMKSLHHYLPTRYQSMHWQCVYSTMRHGISLKTFFANCSNDPTILLIRDEQGSIFGYYSTVGWKPSSQYYGTGESFAFTMSPEFRVYKWSRVNHYHQLSSDSIAIGGGGKFAIFLDDMLERGSSGFCETYASPCLANQEEFEVVVLETYKLVPPYKLQMDDD